MKYCSRPLMGLFFSKRLGLILLARRLIVLVPLWGFSFLNEDKHMTNKMIILSSRPLMGLFFSKQYYEKVCKQGKW